MLSVLAVDVVIHLAGRRKHNLIPLILELYVMPSNLYWCSLLSYCTIASWKSSHSWCTYYAYQKKKWGRGGSGEHKAWVRYRLSYKHAPDLTVRPYLAKVIKKKRWEIKVWKKEGKKWNWLRKRLEPTTWKMVSHALANWASESLGNSVAEFEHLRLSCQGSSRSGYQLACSMGRV